MSIDLSLLPLLSLQGDIKTHLMSRGLPQDVCHYAACELLDLVAQSSAMKDELREAYLALCAAQEPPDPNEAKPGDWLVVVDDGCCTVRLGGPGVLYRCVRQSFMHPDCWELEGVGSPYDKTIFRKATEAEIAAKTRHL